MPPEIAAAPGIVDVSWHNDAAPSFALEADAADARVRLWAEHPDPAQRELGAAYPRYCVTDEDVDAPIYEGDDPAAAVEALRTARA